MLLKSKKRLLEQISTHSTHYKMEKSKAKEEDVIVIKKEDAMQHLNRHQKVALRDIIDTIELGKKEE